MPREFDETPSIAPDPTPTISREDSLAESTRLLRKAKSKLAKGTYPGANRPDPKGPSAGFKNSVEMAKSKAAVTSDDLQAITQIHKTPEALEKAGQKINKAHEALAASSDANPLNRRAAGASLPPKHESLREAANKWAAQEKADIESGRKSPPQTSNEKAIAAKKASMPTQTSTNELYSSQERRGSGPGLDLGEKEPGATLGQAARARGIAASLREGRSSISDTMSHDVPSETDLHVKPWLPHTERGTAVATGAGEEAGAMMGVREQPKDLGRVTAKVARGQYGEVSPKTLRTVKGGFLSRAAESVKGLGEVLGSYGTVSLAAKAAEASKAMKQGKALNPLTLETFQPKEGDTLLTPTGTRKVRAGDPGTTI